MRKYRSTTTKTRRTHFMNWGALQRGGGGGHPVNKLGCFLSKTGQYVTQTADYGLRIRHGL